MMPVVSEGATAHVARACERACWRAEWMLSRRARRGGKERGGLRTERGGVGGAILRRFGVDSSSELEQTRFFTPREA